MIALAIQQGLLGFVRLVATAAAVAGWTGSPMSWSTDARWLGYTVAPESVPSERAPGWLFDTESLQPQPQPRPGPGPGNRDAAGDARPDEGSYRIWASQRDGEASVLIEESPWPLTAPAWSPRGQSLAFGRFVPDSLDPHGSTARGRIEVVVQDGLDHKRTLLALPGFELDPEARALFPHVGPVWSPDGQYLAFPRPGRVPSILIVRLDSRKVLRTLDRALLPAWSSDGTRLAFLQRDDSTEYSLQVLERSGQTFTRPRTILHVGRVAAPISWGDESRSIYVLVEQSGQRFPELNIARIEPETGGATRLLSLIPEELRRGARVRGVVMDFDRDEDLCFFAVDLEGRDTRVCWTVPREKLNYKPFHPIDQSLRVGSLAVAPNGRAVAMRFGVPGALSRPAVFDLATERTTLLVTDEPARRAWLDLLLRTSRSLLAVSLPPAVADGRPLERPTLLPLPDEIPPEHPLQARFRLARLGRLGAALCATPASRGDVEPRAEARAATAVEDRLFFDYLRGDFAAAAADLEDLESRVASRERRLAILSLRAQILWGQGETHSARDVAAYLVEAAGGPVRRIEETPIGRSLVPESGAARAWARYLAARVNQSPIAATSPEPDAMPGERDEAMPINPIAPPEPQGFELRRQRIPGAMPFAPAFPGH